MDLSMHAKKKEKTAGLAALSLLQAGRKGTVKDATARLAGLPHYYFSAKDFNLKARRGGVPPGINYALLLRHHFAVQKKTGPQRKARASKTSNIKKRPWVTYPLFGANTKGLEKISLQKKKQLLQNAINAYILKYRKAHPNPLLDSLPERLKKEADLKKLAEQMKEKSSKGLGYYLAHRTSKKSLAISLFMEGRVQSSATHRPPVIPGLSAAPGGNLSGENNSPSPHHRLRLGPSIWCDSLTTVWNLYDSLYVVPGLVNDSTLIKFFYDNLGISEGYSYWEQELDSCGLPCTPIAVCSEVSSLMAAFESNYPQYADSCPAILWSYYLNFYQGFGLAGELNGFLSPNDWITELNCCSISYPVIDTPSTLCERVEAGVTFYQEYLNSPFGVQNNNTGSGPSLPLFENIMSIFVPGGYYDSGRYIYYPDSYWFNLLDSCHISCPRVVNCTQVQSLMDTFFARSTGGVSDSCPAFIWVQWLNNNKAGGDYLYSAQQWMQILNCCGISYPRPDTLHTRCDTVNLIVNTNIDTLPMPLIGIITNLSQFLAPGTLNTIGYWMSVLDSCGFSCSQFVNCRLLDTTLAQFKREFPAYADSCPPILFTTYFDAAVFSSQFNLILASDSDVINMYACCGIPLPTPDTLSPHCDSALVAYELLQLVSDIFKPSSGSSCLPAWFYDLLVPIIDSFAGIDSLTGICTWMGSCGLPCPDTCSLSDSCATETTFYVLATSLYSLLSPYLVYSAITPIGPAHDSTKQVFTEEQFVQFFFDVLVDSTTTYQQVATQLLLCGDNSLCDTLDHGLQAAGLKLDTFYGGRCIEPLILADLLNAILHLNLTAAQWMQILNQCHFPLPPLCQDSMIGRCDTIAAVDTLLGHLESQYIFSIYQLDSLRSELIAGALGYPVSIGLADSLDSICHDTGCAFISSVYYRLDSVLHYDACYPAWYFTYLWSRADPAGARPWTFSDICTALTNCHLPCPDTCSNLGPGHCDTVFAVDSFVVWARAIFRLDSLQEDSLKSQWMSSLFGSYQSIAACDSIDSMCHAICSKVQAVYLELDTTLLNFDTCYPAWYISTLWTLAYPRGDTLWQFDSICAYVHNCGLSCPDTCGGIGPTHCDTTEAVYYLFRQIAPFAGTDSFRIAKALVNGIFHTAYVNDTAAYLFMVQQYDTCTDSLCSGLYQVLLIADTVFKSLGDNLSSDVFAGLLNALSGQDYGETTWCQLFGMCGFPCPVDTHRLGNFCDSVRAGYALGEHFIAIYGNSFGDSTTLLLQAIEIGLGCGGGNCSYTPGQLLGFMFECIPGAFCRPPDSLSIWGEYVIYQINNFVAANPALMWGTQAALDTTLYHYMDTLFGVSLDWCNLGAECKATNYCPKVDTGEHELCNRPVFPPIQSMTDDSCIQTMQQYAYNNATVAYQFYLQSLYDNFVDGYVSKCLGAYRLEHFKYTHPENEFHYTLYYYDQAGNLVQTVPPNGAWPDSFPHTYLTKYRYNTQNQVVAQITPDAGESYFWYDRIFKLTFSQNAKQRALGQLSYTLYDPIQRIIEVGRFGGFPATFYYGAFDTFATTNQGWYLHLQAYYPPPREVTHTYYDYDQLGIASHFGTTGITNLRNRVASIIYTDTLTPDSTHYNAATHYSYDVDGNVQTLLQENRSLKSIHEDFKRTDYQYDLISGKVNTVMYQRGHPDAFYHVYNYDADNRITDVYTSRDSIFFDHDAFYQYYLHGPLARAVIGEKQVQGVNYAYTLQGWLKAVNGDIIYGDGLMGQDGNSTYPNALVGRALYGFSLGYFGGDYSPVAMTNIFDPFLTADAGLNPWDLYNGNISRYKEFNLGLAPQPTSFPPTNDTGMAYRYRYDQLNRLTGMNADRYTYSYSPYHTTYTATSDYAEQVQYDPNGNILGYIRNGSTLGGSPLGMDSLTYRYQASNNKLDHVNDAVPASNYSVDIDNEDTLNYRYDQIGNLTKDSSGKIDSIYWTVYGKIWKIVKFNGDTIKFRYGPDGNRIAKEVFSDSLNKWTNTYYVHDAQGNIMATYQWFNRDTFTLDELVMYGSSRLGTINTNMYLTDTTTHDSAWWAAHPSLGNPLCDSVIDYTSGIKQYEFTNHLGNVLLTLTDRHTPIYSGIGGAFAFYRPEVASAQDYYPFGMIMPRRNYRDTSFRFGFNNKEKDDEVYGIGNSIDYTKRILDPRLGRFLSVDPLTNSYPWYTPFQFAGNKPIMAVDLDGKEEHVIILDY